MDEKAGSVYTVSFHQMILFGFSRFCVNLCIILFGFFELVIFAKLHFASQQRCKITTRTDLGLAVNMEGESFPLQKASGQPE